GLPDGGAAALRLLRSEQRLAAARVRDLLRARLHLHEGRRELQHQRPTGARPQPPTEPLYRHEGRRDLPRLHPPRGVLVRLPAEGGRGRREENPQRRRIFRAGVFRRRGVRRALREVGPPSRDSCRPGWLSAARSQWWCAAWPAAPNRRRRKTWSET